MILGAVGGCVCSAWGDILAEIGRQVWASQTKSLQVREEPVQRSWGELALENTENRKVSSEPWPKMRVILVLVFWEGPTRGAKKRLESKRSCLQIWDHPIRAGWSWANATASLSAGRGYRVPGLGECVDEVRLRSQCLGGKFALIFPPFLVCGPPRSSSNLHLGSRDAE